MKAMSSISVKYVSKKISKVRWRPRSSSIFVTGSWDDRRNNLCIWSYPGSQSKELSVRGDTDSADPQVLVETPVRGGVADIKVTINDLIFVSSCRGSLHIYKFPEKKLVHHHSWTGVHTSNLHPTQATSIAVKGNDVTTVGADGCLCIFNFSKLQRVRRIVSSHLCAFTSVSYLRHQEIAAGNVLGYLMTWDLRSGSEQPTHTLMASADQVSVMNMNVHPTQTHVLATGHQDGTVCIWDLRQESRPATVLAGHSDAVTDILFHPLNPDYLYTCSMDGSVWQWNSSALKKGSLPNGGSEQNIVSGNPWLNCDASKHRLDVISLFPLNITPVNSLDISESVLLWGTDSEALYILPDITL